MYIRCHYSCFNGINPIILPKENWQASRVAMAVLVLTSMFRSSNKAVLDLDFA